MLPSVDFRGVKTPIDNRPTISNYYMENKPNDKDVIMEDLPTRTYGD